MRILITNDDGIHADGLEALEKIARQLSDDVWVVAPESDQSGVAHSLSLNDPLRLRTISDKRFAVKGTPTDCVIMAIRHLMVDRKPDLVLSGINRGHNVAEDVTYSGTIAGAMEGAILGIPALALSQEFGFENRQHPPWDTALRYGPEVIRKVLAAGMPRGTLVNINFPSCSPDEVKGVAVTRQGARNLDLLNIDERRDGRGNPYYWIAFVRGIKPDPSETDTDLAALATNYVSVTPLRLDLTDKAFAEKLAAGFK